MHALVIEDDAVIAMFIEDELQSLGFRSVETVSAEKEAIAAVSRRSPDLVTSDGSLLSGSGVGAARAIRKILNMPVIFITGDPQAAHRAMPGAPVLAKPFTLYQLADAVRGAVQGAGSIGLKRLPAPMQA
jgi:DNA-binding response OmpR family regulator